MPWINERNISHLIIISSNFGCEARELPLMACVASTLFLRGKCIMKTWPSTGILWQWHKHIPCFYTEYSWIRLPQEWLKKIHSIIVSAQNQQSRLFLVNVHQSHAYWTKFLHWVNMKNNPKAVCHRLHNVN
jgi:hypothetical protein